MMIVPMAVVVAMMMMMRIILQHKRAEEIHKQSHTAMTIASRK